jgi:hypothetical protein
MATIISQVNNPITGQFGNGFVQVFGSSGTWPVPDGVNNVRVRIFGAAGYNGGGGGGFGIKTIYNLAGSGVTAVAVTVGVASTSTGGTSSFGSYLTVTGGASTGSPALGGTSTGGDINYTGGSGWNGYGGGGVANLFGNGGNAQQSTAGPGSSGASGGGAATAGFSGGSGISGAGGFFISGTPTSSFQAQSGNTIGSIDYIGTGGGGAVNITGANGGGGGNNASGGFPGGGGGGNFLGGGGLVILEW